MMCPSADDLKIQASWDGAKGESRASLLSELSSKLPLCCTRCMQSRQVSRLLPDVAFLTPLRINIAQCHDTGAQTGHSSRRSEDGLDRKLPLPQYRCFSIAIH